MPKGFTKERLPSSGARSSMDNAAVSSCTSAQDPKGRLGSLKENSMRKIILYTAFFLSHTAS